MVVGYHGKWEGGDLHQPILAGSAVLRRRDRDILAERIRIECLRTVVDDERLGVVGVLDAELVVLVVGEAGTVPSLEMSVLPECGYWKGSRGYVYIYMLGGVPPVLHPRR